MRVLIADREENMRMIIRNVLYDLGFSLDHIRLCENGKDALELLTIGRSDILITCLRMTPIDGLSLIRKLRDPKSTPAPEIPIIFCSAVLDMQLLDDVRQAGANEILLKPVNAARIKSRIDTIIEKPRPTVRLANYIGPDRRRLPDIRRPNDRRVRNHWDI
jgi:two-component system, chemotaxis family, chemotaxis protein CheY